MKRLVSSLFILINLISLTVLAVAHPGSTDGSGGHFDRFTGEYHYHHGYSAHQHENGECPYNFNDRTGYNSGSSTSSGSSSTHSVLQENVEELKEMKSLSVSEISLNFEQNKKITIIIFSILAVVCYFYLFIYYDENIV